MANSLYGGTIPSRAGIKDVWNAFMVEGAVMLDEDIPLCPTTARIIPESIITWREAKERYEQQLRKGRKDFQCDAFVCWYMDDQNFDTSFGIWRRPRHAMKVLSHFKGIVTPDFSLYQDFPKPLKLFNVYRMRAFGYWCGTQGLEVINNVRWGTPETWGYCFIGIPHHSVVAVGAVASDLKKLSSRPLFEEGLFEMVRVLKPHTVIVYGSANYSFFYKLQNQGIRVIAFDSDAAKRFEAGKADE